jgi:hypothetical protein
MSKSRELSEMLVESSNNTFDTDSLLEYEKSKMVCPVCSATMENKSCDCGYSESMVFSCPYIQEKDKSCGVSEGHKCTFEGLDYETCDKWHSHWE